MITEQLKPGWLVVCHQKCNTQWPHHSTSEASKQRGELRYCSKDVLIRSESDQTTAPLESRHTSTKEVQQWHPHVSTWIDISISAVGVLTCVMCHHLRCGNDVYHLMLQANILSLFGIMLLSKVPSVCLLFLFTQTSFMLVETFSRHDAAFLKLFTPCATSEKIRLSWHHHKACPIQLQTDRQCTGVHFIHIYIIIYCSLSSVTATLFSQAGSGLEPSQ